MIPYDVHMSAKDLMDYWGFPSYILAKDTQTKLWRGFHLSEAGAVLTLTGRQDAAHPDPCVRVMTREEFFKECLLHRPHLPIIKYGNGLYVLEWKPEARNRHRGLSDKDFRVWSVWPKAGTNTRPEGCDLLVAGMNQHELGINPKKQWLKLLATPVNRSNAELLYDDLWAHISPADREPPSPAYHRRVTLCLHDSPEAVLLVHYEGRGKKGSVTSAESLNRMPLSVYRALLKPCDVVTEGDDVFGI